MPKRLKSGSGHHGLGICEPSNGRHKIAEPFSTGKVEIAAADDGAGTADNKDKDSSVHAWQAQAARASGSSRTLLPPPVESPPRALSHKGGVLRRRGSSRARLHRGSRRGLDFDHGHDRGSSSGSSGSDGGGDGGGGGGGGGHGRIRPIRSRNSDFIQDRDCSSRSSSRSSRNSTSSRSSRSYRSSRNISRSTSGEDRRAHDVDDLRKNSEEISREVHGEREVRGEGRDRSKEKTKHVEKETTLSRVHGGHHGRRDRDDRMRQPKDKTIGKNGEHKPSAQPQKRHDNTRNGKTAESARRMISSPCSTVRSDRDDAGGYNGQTSESSPTRGCRSGGSEKRRDSSAKAQGSETTATPSPRDPSASGGLFGESVNGSTNNQIGLAWPTGTASASSSVHFRRNKAYGQGLGEGGIGSFDGSGQRHSTPSSPTTKAHTRREGKHPPPDLVFDDDDDDDDDDDNNNDNNNYDNDDSDGGEKSVELGVLSSEENRNCSTAAFASYRHPSRANVSLGDNEKRHVRREAGSKPYVQSNRGSVGRVDTRHASRNYSYQRNQVCHDETVGDRLNIRGRDKSGHEGRTGEDRPERDHTSSPGEDEHRCGGGGGDGDHGSEKLSGKTHLQETGCGTPRASAGGWFAVEGQKEEGGKTEVRGIDCSSDSSGGNGRCRLKAERMRAGNGVDGGERGGGTSGGGGGGCDGGDRGYCGALPPNERQKQCLSLMLAYERGKTSDLVQCVIVRDRSGMNRLYPQYRFFFQGKEHQLMMVAQKCSKNRSSNYHVFDMHRGGFRTRLSKKNGNYLGKVRTNLKRTEATVFTNDQEVAELGAISFEKPGLVGHLRDGSQPRKFSVLLPALDCDGAPLAHKVDPYDDDSHMLSYINQGRHGSMFLLRTREPTFTKGNYRLNFRGRVTVPSVKNFQLVSPDDTQHTVCQFGKVGEDRFHLDYRAPINAFQAFCITLAQFNF